MALAILLPSTSLKHVRLLFPTHVLRLATSWAGLDSIIGSEDIEAVVFDPTARSHGNEEMARILTKHPSTLFLAYVRCTPQNFRAVFLLSKAGLQYVFVHAYGGGDRCFQDAIKNSRADRLVLDLLAEMEIQLAGLPPELVLTITDLFQRPYRYESATDLAQKAAVPIRQLYRRFSNAGLKTPKQLLILAKTIRAYGFLRWRSDSVWNVSKAVGDSTPRVLGRQIASVFKCSPTQLHNGSNEELLIRVAEWMNKPTHLRPNAGGQRALG